MDEVRSFQQEHQPPAYSKGLPQANKNEDLASCSDMKGMVCLERGAYERVRQIFLAHLIQQRESGSEVKESDLIVWYMERIEDLLETEEQFNRELQMLQAVIDIMQKSTDIVVSHEKRALSVDRVIWAHPSVSL